MMIFQDGQAFKEMDGVLRTPNVLDNLIYRREIPVMITVFINPGRTPEQPEPTRRNWGDRDTNRPAEYNSLESNMAGPYTPANDSATMRRTRALAAARWWGPAEAR